MEKLGVSNITPIVLLAVEMGNVGDQMGRVKGMQRYMLLTQLFDEATGLAAVDFSKVKAEIKDFDAQEREEMLGKVRMKLDIADDQLEAVIEEGLAIIEDLYTTIDRSINLVKKFKEEKEV